MPESTVLVAFDGSPASRQAVLEAAQLMRAVRLVVATVWEPALAYATPSGPTDMPIMTPVMDPNASREIEHALHGRADRLAQEGAALATSRGVEAEPVALADEGNVASTLLELARQLSAVAIVVGSRGLTGLRARLEGSTSRELIKHAPCPVLVVHEPHG